MPTRNRSGGSDQDRQSRRSWAPEFRLEVARAVVARGTPQTAVARVFGVPLTTASTGRGGTGRKVRRPCSERVLAVVPGEEQTAGGPRKRAPRGGDASEARAPRPRHAEDPRRCWRGCKASVSETTVRRILH
jgi:transposase-like protein